MDRTHARQQAFAPYLSKGGTASSLIPCREEAHLIDCLASGPTGQEIAFGLSQNHKSIPSKYFYDARGSRLFDEICTLPEYYPTRTELEILHKYAAFIMSVFRGREGDLIEIGSGSDLKVRKLLEAVPRHGLRKIRYVPMDISHAGLVQSSLSILRDFEGLRICGIIGDFTCHLSRLPGGRKLITFFGGTAGTSPTLKGSAAREHLQNHGS